MKLSPNSKGPIIQFVAKTKGLSQKELADQFEVSTGAISRAVNGDKKLSSLKIKIVEFINGYSK